MIPASIVITNPALWIGLIAICLPLLIHLLTRKTPVRLPFPSLRLLEKAKSSSSSLFRLRHWILLAVRTLALLFLLAAFLKPMLQSNVVHGMGQKDQPQAVVVLLDASMSMGVVDSGQSMFTRAKRAAEQVIRDLRPGDRANLVYGALPSVLSYPEPSTQHENLVADLRAAEVTVTRPDVDSLVADGLAQLADCEGFRKVLYVISDFQRSHWAAVQTDRFPKDVDVVLISVAPERVDNLFVTDLLLDPSTPTEGEPVQLRYKIVNQGGADATVPVEILLDGEVVHRATVTVPAASSVVDTCDWDGFPKGIHEGRIRLPSDALVADDETYFVLRVGQPLNVLLVSDADDRSTSVPSLLDAAVNPFRDEDGFYLSTNRRGTSELSALASEGRPFAIFADVGSLAPSDLEQVADYLERGGSVIWFLVSSGDGEALWNLHTQYQVPVPFRPLNLVQIRRGSGRDSANLASANFDHPILRRFRDTTDLPKIRFHRYFTTERFRGVGQVLAKYGNGHVAMAIQAVGAGQLLVCNFSPHPRHSDLANGVLFVPMVHEIIRAMRPRTGGAAATVVGTACGTALASLESAANLTFEGPDGEQMDVSFQVDQDRGSILFPSTERAGFYRVLDSGRLIASMAANVDHRESEVSYLSDVQVSQVLEQIDSQLVSVSKADARSVDALQHGRPLWHLALLLMLGVLCTEQVLCGWWRN